MWNKSREEILNKRISNLEEQVATSSQDNKRIREDHQFELKKRDQEHTLAIAKLKAEQLNENLNFKDTELEKERELRRKAEKEIAVFKKENEMLTKITDLNGDVIDIKELVSNLIKKLPEINVSTLNFTGTPALTDGKSK